LIDDIAIPRIHQEERHMRITMTAAGLLAALAAAPAMSVAQEATDTTAAQPVAAELAAADMEFFRSALGGGKAEVALGELASEKGDSPDVREYGQRLAQDHAGANEKLLEIARQKQLDEPADLPPDAKQLIERLSSLSGPEFDRQYIMEMVSGHETTIDSFEQQAEGGQDADLKSFAAEALPTLHGHLEQARTIQASLQNIAGETSTDLEAGTQPSAGSDQQPADTQTE
jgi:putative membrane protein